LAREALTHLRFAAPLEEYEAQARQLWAGHQASDEATLRLLHQHHPLFLDAKIPWLPRRLTLAEIAATPLTLDGARLGLARAYHYQDWDALVTHRREGDADFEAAVEAVIDGDAATLATLLRARPELVQARSTRVCCFDPPVHGATLLHYLAANGVEHHRQRTPASAVAILHQLMDAGAGANSLAMLYGGACTTLSLLVSSSPPHAAGLQTALAEALLDRGAELEPRGAGQWTSPLQATLAFGFAETARLLVRRGAPITLEAAAAFDDVAALARLLPSATPLARHRALALAAQWGAAGTLAPLLNAGEDPNRYNPPGLHAHATPLHQAALGGHTAAVRLLLARGARLDQRDTIYQSTPQGWAEHAGHPALAALLTPLA